jgi:hypothetical protein
MRKRAELSHIANGSMKNKFNNYLITIGIVYQEIVKK